MAYTSVANPGITYGLRPLNPKESVNNRPVLKSKAYIRPCTAYGLWPNFSNINGHMACGLMAHTGLLAKAYGPNTWAQH